MITQVWLAIIGTGLSIVASIVLAAIESRRPRIASQRAIEAAKHRLEVLLACRELLDASGTKNPELSRQAELAIEDALEVIRLQSGPRPESQIPSTPLERFLLVSPIRQFGQWFARAWAFMAVFWLAVILLGTVARIMHAVFSSPPAEWSFAMDLITFVIIGAMAGAVYFVAIISDQPSPDRRPPLWHSLLMISRPSNDLMIIFRLVLAPLAAMVLTIPLLQTVEWASQERPDQQWFWLGWVALLFFVILLMLFQAAADRSAIRRASTT